jgi:hypothetical protein
VLESAVHLCGAQHTFITVGSQSLYSDKREGFLCSSTLCTCAPLHSLPLPRAPFLRSSRSLPCFGVASLLWSGQLLQLAFQFPKLTRRGRYR